MFRTGYGFFVLLAVYACSDLGIDDSVKPLVRDNPLDPQVIAAKKNQDSFDFKLDLAFDDGALIFTWKDTSTLAGLIDTLVIERTPCLTGQKSSCKPDGTFTEVATISLDARRYRSKDEIDEDLYCYRIGIVKGEVKTFTGSNLVCSASFDYDNDGLANIVEKTQGTALLKIDSDDDGFSDFDEIGRTKTDPLKLDSDGDGLDDLSDCAPLSIDPIASLDSDKDGSCDDSDPDDDNDGVIDDEDSRPRDRYLCHDLDGDGCDECAIGIVMPVSADGPDLDADSLCNRGDDDRDGDGVSNESDAFPDDDAETGDKDADRIGDNDDIDDDNDGLPDLYDAAPSDPRRCKDEDGDGCDECSSGKLLQPNNDGLDTDHDGICDGGDLDDDGDGAADQQDLFPTDPKRCYDADKDNCDECATGLLATVSTDGPDQDNDGLCDSGDEDLDGDGSINKADEYPNNKYSCYDHDNDTCDECASGFLVTTPDDGPDYDKDGLCDQGDPDDDNDGVADQTDRQIYDALHCDDADHDDCDECATGKWKPISDDGADLDRDGICDKGDPDIDNDGLDNDSEVAHGSDPRDRLSLPPDLDGDGAFDYEDDDIDSDQVSNTTDVLPRDANLCHDLDGDTCDECTSGKLRSVTDDGADLDHDGICDGGDTDIDGDGVQNSTDLHPDDPFLCMDKDSDGCDECSSGGIVAVNSDGIDTDNDGLCDLGDEDDDGDGITDVDDSHPIDRFHCKDADGDGCDECVNGSAVLTSLDGFDFDGDGLCDFGDSDDDNDGMQDIADSDAANGSRCADADHDLCDECSNGTYRDPLNDGFDTDSDGLCNYGDNDDDNDGILDDNDACHYDPDTANSNNDGDSLCDTNDPDDDNDGLPDSVETNTGIYDSSSDTGTNSLDPDGDDDGIKDGVETNTGVWVSTNDRGTDPFDPDSDNDGLSDGVETNTWIWAAQTDTGTNPHIADTDSDGVADGIDSHPLNMVRCADADRDGCDECWPGNMQSTTNDGNDTDRDGICDLGDSDDDNDGLPDNVETNTGTWVSASDTGTDPLNDDSDGDGNFDGVEAEDSTNPNDSNDYLHHNLWVTIAGGTFQMGSTTGPSNEQPVHQVTVSAFHLQKYEVTAAEYKACVDAAVCVYNGQTSGTYYTYSRAGYENHPINYVNWSEARTYCQWLGGDLPTEAQWEYAARGTAGRTYPWGNDAPSSSNTDKANCAESYCYDGYQYTAPVGSFPNGATPEGLNDLAGNLWEWNLDWYGSYSSSAEVDPTGPASGSYRVLRGGSFSNGTSNIRSASRINDNPGDRDNDIGFRCAAAAQD